MNDNQPGLDAQLAADFDRLRHDPLGWVMYAFPWGEPGPLEDRTGPEPWQREVLEHIGDQLRAGVSPIMVAVASGHGVGKAMALTEPVLTPHGWREIGALVVGDLVATVDGTFTRVTGVYPQGPRRLYRVTLDDGCSVLADWDHLWLTTTRGERKRGKPAQVRTTGEIAGTLTFPNGPRPGLNHRLPTLAAVEHPWAILPVDPYMLGAMLGDGDAAGRISVGCAALDETMTQLRAVGCPLTEPYRSGGGWVVSLQGSRGTGARAMLKKLGLLGCRAHEKFVPDVYRFASVSQRTALLQGILDTDGTVGANNAVVLDITAPLLADHVAELVRSLGGVVRRSEKWGQLNGKRCRKVYRLYLSLPADVSPFRLPSKANRYRPQNGHRNRDRTLGRFIKSVEHVGVDLAVCITVEHPSRLFVTRDHIVTHNSALMAWIRGWSMSTCSNTRGIVTANTEVQLRTKTLPEFAKWHQMQINGEWFDGSFSYRYQRQPEHSETWRFDAIPWSETRPEAFAGLHNAGNRIVVLYDEASAIADVIWETTEGALTDADTEILWLAFGNPTRASGRFAECWGRHRSRWRTWRVDARTVSHTNKEQLQAWIDAYGEDSDFVRVRVLGQQPRAASTQFIASDVVEAAIKREASAMPSDIWAWGLDVARQGDDMSVLAKRRGRDARTWPARKWRIRDTMQLASHVAQEWQDASERGDKPDGLFVDGGGVGGGVVDRLRQLGIPVVEVQFGGAADQSSLGTSGATGERYANKRAEMWGAMRAWLEVGCIPNDPELTADLTGVEYGFAGKGGDEIVLERKQDMKKRGLASPDYADALACTFAYPLVKRGVGGQAAARRSGIGDYDPHEAWR